MYFLFVIFIYLLRFPIMITGFIFSCTSFKTNKLLLSNLSIQRVEWSSQTFLLFNSNQWSPTWKGPKIRNKNFRFCRQGNLYCYHSTLPEMSRQSEKKHKQKITNKTFFKKACIQTTDELVKTVVNHDLHFPFILGWACKLAHPGEKAFELQVLPSNKR